MTHTYWSFQTPRNSALIVPNLTGVVDNFTTERAQEKRTNVSYDLRRILNVSLADER